MAGLRLIDTTTAKRRGSVFDNSHPKLELSYKVITVENERPDVGFRIKDVTLEICAEAKTLVAPLGIPYGGTTLVKPRKEGEEPDQVDLHAATLVSRVFHLHKQQLEPEEKIVKVEYVVRCQPEPETDVVAGNYGLFIEINLLEVSGYTGMRSTAYAWRPIP